MSYINLESGPGFSKAVISFWFQVPQESLDAASKAYKGEDGVMLDGVVPLVVMGQEGTGQTPSHQEITEDVLTFTGGSGTGYTGGLVDVTAECTSVVGPFDCCKTSVITSHYECNAISLTQPEVHDGITYKTTATGPGPKTDPTFIGVDATGGRPTLYVNFESTQKPRVSNYAYEISSITPGTARTGYVLGSCVSGTRGFGCDVLCCVCLIIECSNDADNGNGFDDTTPSPPEHGGTEPTSPKNNWTEIPFAENKTGAIYGNEVDVSADEWHHVLISVDLGPVVTHGGEWDGKLAPFVDSAAKLWVAMDDKNYTKFNLSENWAEKGDNDVITDGAYNVAGTSPNEDAGGGMPRYSLDSTAVPTGSLGMPASKKYVDNIHHVEMAEFQMWTGVTLDTGTESNRRAFIDYKRDENGKVIPEKDGSKKLKPVNPKKAEKLLGKKPNILLHGSGKWKRGDNTGESRGDFVPSKGAIESYKPDPILGG